MFAIDSKWNPFLPLIPYREHDGFDFDRSDYKTGWG